MKAMKLIFSLTALLVLASCNFYECDGPCGEQVFTGIDASVILSGPTAGDISRCLGPYSVSLVDAQNNGTTYTSDVEFVFSGATLYSSGSCQNQISSLNLAKGNPIAQFYLREDVPRFLNLIAASNLGTNSLSVQIRNLSIALAGPSSGNINSCVGPYIFSIQDQFGNAGSYARDLSYNISGLPSYSDGNCSNSASTLTLNTGQSQSTFYVRGTSATNANISVSSILGNRSLSLSLSPTIANVSLTGPTTGTVNQCLGPYQIEIQDSQGAPTTHTTDIDFTTSGITAYSSSNCSSASNSFTITSGSSDVEFYVEASTAVTATLAADSNLGNGTLLVTIEDPSAATQVVIVGPDSGEANTCIGPYEVQLQNAAGQAGTHQSDLAVRMITQVVNYTDSACTQGESDFTIPQGQSSFSFYLMAGPGTYSTQATTSQFATASKSVTFTLPPLSVVIRGRKAGTNDPFVLDSVPLESGDSIELQWDIQGATSCSPFLALVPNPLNQSSVVVGPLSAKREYRLSCSRGNGINDTMSSVIVADIPIDFTISMNPAVSPAAPYDFGDVRLGERKFGYFYLTNTGNVRVSNLTLSNPSGSFRFYNQLTNSCAGASLSPGDQCSVAVIFEPTGTGVLSANLSMDYQYQINSTQTGQARLDFHLMGTGIVIPANAGLDTSFGTNGSLELDMADPIGIAIHSNGHIVASSGYETRILNSSGQQLHAVVLNFPDNASYGMYAMKMQLDGKVIVAGYERSNGHLRMARINLDGTLDTSFSGDGYVTTAIELIPRSIDIMANGRILVLGDDFSFVSRIAKFESNGVLVPGFGQGGVINLDSGIGLSETIDSPDYIHSAGNQIFVSGRALCGTSRGQVALVALSFAGAPTWDPTVKCMGPHPSGFRQTAIQEATSGLRFLYYAGGLKIADLNYSGVLQRENAYPGPALGTFGGVIKANGTTLAVGDNSAGANDNSNPADARLFDGQRILRVTFPEEGFTGGSSTLYAKYGDIQEDYKVVLAGPVGHHRTKIVRYLANPY